MSQIESRNLRSSAVALPRSLRRFLSSVLSSPIVRLTFGNRKTGSYPRPRVPRGAWEITPDTSPWTVQIMLPARATAVELAQCFPDFDDLAGVGCSNDQSSHVYTA